jgi:hypothetical protein
MFPPRVWDLDNLTAYCTATYGVTPRPNWLLTEFGAGNISSSASNIIFSNGLLDPVGWFFFSCSFQVISHRNAAAQWSSGGFMQSLSPTLPAVIIAEGAHHLDLRGADPRDPPSVIAARAAEIATLQKWIAELRAKPAAHSAR